jgi:demethylmenaquinone methyltransferase / 2-methoxy-6-polyprenyl-1,4-benzoquinol methylase
MTDAPAWTDDLLRDPHAIADKRRRVQTMFEAIAPRYDLNNRLHSFWRDQAWRRKTAGLAELKPDDVVVDVACGTGDLTMRFAAGLALLNAAIDRAPKPGQVIGVDFTYGMLPIAVAKREAMLDETDREAFGDLMQFVNGDAQSLPLPDASCDVLSIAFGIRNVQDIAAALAEFRRVLRPGGRLLVLEFSEPTNPILRALNRFYTHTVMPRTATWISRDRSGAYRYLPKSIEKQIGRAEMEAAIRAAGFGPVTQHPMTFGVCVCYRATVEETR